jgi:hypothetical protein
MTEPVTVHTPFGDREVSEDEAAELRAQGLLLDAAPAEQVPPEDVEVETVFSPMPVRMPAAEAAALDAQGLLVHADPPKPRRADGPAKKEQ